MNMNLPAGVGPHEGIEYALMNSGQKDVALFELVPAEFEQNELGLSLERIALDRHTTIFFMKGKEWKAQALVTLILQGRKTGFDEKLERSIGRLLGYEENDIDTFIEHAKSMQEEMEKLRREARRVR